MVQRDMPWPPGTPCWADLSVGDTGQAKAFYSALFGWEVQDGPPEAEGYMHCEIDGRPVAGIGPKMGPDEEPNAWTTYLASEDADETVGKITAAGGQVLTPPYDIMDLGRFALATDTDGGEFGVWQAARLSGIQLANEPGAVCWNENMSRNLDANKAFYQAVFGYQYDDVSSADFRYATFRTTGDSLGGIGEIDASLPAEVPAHWLTYFTVADTDDVVAVAASLGGHVMREARDTPYGRMAVLSDDQGAVFAIMSLAGQDAAEG
jgi:predicted enzyme related to lactoylglutathione lyase